MGSPKALLNFKGETFFERILEAVRASGITEIVAVVGHHREEIQRAFPDFSFVFNPKYTQGMSTSVQAGIRALPNNVMAVGVFLVDHPLIDSETIMRLVSEATRDRIVLPVYRGRRGHPVFIGADIFREVLDLDADHGLNTVVRREPGRVHEVEVQNAEVLRDVDTPEQFENLLREKL